MSDRIDEIMVENILKDLKDGDTTEEFIESISYANPSYKEALRLYREWKGT
jgi:uncharacterized protein (DUF433 family)